MSNNNIENTELSVANTNSNNYFTPTSDGVYFFAILIKYRKFLIVFTILAAIASVIISYNMKIWFCSTINFVPPQESSSSSSVSGLSSMMKDFGLSKIGGGNSQEYTMLVFLESRSVIDSVINKYNLIEVYDIKEKKMSDTRKEFLSNLKIEYLEEGNYELTVWDTDKQRACDIANDYIQITNYFAEKTHKDELDVNANYLTNRIQSIDSTITAISLELGKISSEKKLFSPEEQAKAASTALATIKATEMEYEIYYDFYKENYGENDPLTMNAKELWQAAKNKINDAYSKPGFIGDFALKDVTPIAANYLSKMADIEALSKTKAMLTTSLEKAILDNKNVTHNFFVIDKAIPADKKDKPKKAFIVAGGTLGGLIFGIFIILLINGFKISLKQAKQFK